jgi:hypothetical protein
LVKVVQQGIGQGLVRQRWLGIPHRRMKHGQAMQRTRRLGHWRILSTGFVNTAIGINEQQTLHQHDGKGIPVRVGSVGLLELELSRLGIAPQRIHKASGEHSTGKRPELKRVSIDQISFSALDQYIQVVEIADRHPHPMQLRQRLMQVAKNVDHPLGSNRLAKTPLAIAQQQLRLIEPGHGIAQNLLPPTVIGQILGRNHPGGNIGGELSQLLLMLFQSPLGGLPGFGLVGKVGMVRGFKHFHRRLARPAIHFRFTALAN